MPKAMSGKLEDMMVHSTRTRNGLSDECGCPEEEWSIGMFDALIHIDPDGTGDIFLDCGDFQLEKNVPCESIEDLRGIMASWVYSIPINNDL